MRLAGFDATTRTLFQLAARYISRMNVLEHMFPYPHAYPLNYANEFMPVCNVLIDKSFHELNLYDIYRVFALSSDVKYEHKYATHMIRTRFKAALDA